jgi:hypothetical protein
MTECANFLWQIGHIEKAAADFYRLADELRLRPTIDAVASTLLANLLGIFSELGRVDDAAIFAPQALETQRRTGEYYPENWAYFFWRRGQVEVAAQLAGAADALRARTGIHFESIELRLITQVRAALEAQLAANELARHLTVDAAFGKHELYDIIARALR